MFDTLKSDAQPGCKPGRASLSPGRRIRATRGRRCPSWLMAALVATAAMFIGSPMPVNAMTLDIPSCKSQDSRTSATLSKIYPGNLAWFYQSKRTVFGEFERSVLLHCQTGRAVVYKEKYVSERGNVAAQIVHKALVGSTPFPMKELSRELRAAGVTASAKNVGTSHCICSLAKSRIPSVWRYEEKKQ
ncbi:MAG: hypothetical protein GY952_17710 [Rhodobacteraceae bacterium]|nr:hypothetical protein [Paracoccaceae bacterium]